MFVKLSFTYGFSQLIKLFSSHAVRFERLIGSCWLFASSVTVVMLKYKLPDLCKTDENAALGFSPQADNFRNIVSDHCHHC